MKLSKTCDIGKFSNYFAKYQNRRHSIKLVVDDVIIDVSCVILSWWTDEFESRADEDNEIFLTDFIGYKENIYQCVSLLHGHEVAVEFDNVSVILKFAHSFKIPELVDKVMCWFQEHISETTLSDIINIASDLGNIGCKFDRLIEIVSRFVEDNLEGSSEIIKENFEVNRKTVIDVLVYNGPLLIECIRLFNSNIRLEKDYVYLVDKLEIMTVENMAILNANVDEINMIMGSIVRDVEDSKVLKRWIKLMICIKSSDSSNEQILLFQSWRTFSKEEILDLKQKYDISEFCYTVIYLDWVQINKPKQEDVLEIFLSIQKEKVEHYFLNYCIGYMVRDVLGYTDIPDVMKLPEYEYDIQYCGITDKQLLDSLNNNTTIKLSCRCDLDSCDADEENYHTVNIRFVVESDQVKVEVVPAVDLPPHQHTHQHYTHWYFRVNFGHGDIVCPFYTKSYREILEFVDGAGYIGIHCLIRKH